MAAWSQRGVAERERAADIPRVDDGRRSILFVRSVALPLALTTLAALRAASPGARISVLTNQASACAIDSTGAADEIIQYSAARFGIFAAGLRRVLTLRARRFDVILVPYVGTSWLPFWNVGRFALTLGGREALWLPADRLAARGKSLAAFDGRCILGGCVAPPSNTAGILGRRALPPGRLARLGATPDFHHGLLGSRADLADCDRVSLAEWSRAVTPAHRARLALVTCLKWPALLAVTAAILVTLAIATPILFAFVWLTPAAENTHGS